MRRRDVGRFLSVRRSIIVTTSVIDQKVSLRAKGNSSTVFLQLASPKSCYIPVPFFEEVKENMVEKFILYMFFSTECNLYETGRCSNSTTALMGTHLRANYSIVVDIVFFLVVISLRLALLVYHFFFVKLKVCGFLRLTLHLNIVYGLICSKGHIRLL